MVTLSLFRTFFRGMSLGLFILLVAACARPPASHAPERAPMQAQDLPLQTWHLFDVGVTDVNGDGALDIFSSNHSARQSLLLGDGAGAFSANQLAALHLDQSADFPGLADSEDTPEFDQPGLYIFWRQSHLILHSHRPAAPLSGQITLFTPVELTPGTDFDVTQTQEDARTRITFSATDEAELALTPQPYPRVGVPILVDVATSVPLAQIFLGARGVSPQQRHLLLSLQDRHGLAWADFNRDGQQDLLVAGGANRGLPGPEDASIRPYELFYQNQGAFQRTSAPEMGLIKQSCAARQIGLMDVDNNGWLDVYIVCARSANQLFMQTSPGQFTEMAADLGLNLPGAGHFAWLDVEPDGDADLLWAGEQGVWLYRQQAAHFTPEKLDGPKIWAQNIAVGDYDNDGDGDIFIASADAALLYQNDAGRLTGRKPQDLGLPGAGLHAQWLDFDNDGWQDLHVVDAGLYLQTEPSRFTLADVLPPAPGPLKSARGVWFDANDDGYRELLVATQDNDKRWQSRYFRHPGGQNHWLALDLQGPPGNSPALWAQVHLSAAGKDQTQVVGWNESSHYGSGHDRLYFGLGAATQITSLDIRWPDGRTQHLSDLAADQRLVIKWQP